MDAKVLAGMVEAEGVGGVKVKPLGCIDEYVTEGRAGIACAVGAEVTGEAGIAGGAFCMAVTAGEVPGLGAGGGACCAINCAASP